MFYFFLIFKNVKTIVTSQLCKNRQEAGFGPQAGWQALVIATRFLRGRPYSHTWNGLTQLTLTHPDEVDVSVVSLLQLGKLSLREIQLLT